MGTGDDPALVDTARAIIEANLYMTLATADADGRPWPTPVYFAPVDDRELVWVSSPEARHSRNIAARPDVGIVVFDSQVPINRGQAVYMEAEAEVVPAGALDRCLDGFSRSCQHRGGLSWSTEDVGPTARLRLYRAIVSERWVLDDHDHRIPVPLGLPPS
ncbi:MAG TPA: pyridoxamine 5'-phosphate oxidase family protein [Iamia sp.]|jgi:pyridoxine/pyridoxamine 5'-phosphate oxidase|nr:pyridoxamine 5'-phosphate oxidase family protein [Iamia sp.]